jgi:hypothetical protein
MTTTTEKLAAPLFDLSRQLQHARRSAVIGEPALSELRTAFENY